MTDPLAADEFERHRPYPISVAYRMLAPLHSDGAGWVSGVVTRPVEGTERVARFLLGVASRHIAVPGPRRVNGTTGLIFEPSDGVVGVMGLAAADNHVTEIDFVLKPDKPQHVRIDHTPPTNQTNSEN